MVKKESKLFDYDNETKKKKESKKRKIKKNSKKNNKNDSDNNSFDFSNEIIIGLPRLDDPKVLKEKTKKKSKKEKIKKEKNKKEKKIEKQRKSKIYDKERNKKVENKIEENIFDFDSSSEQDIIIQTNTKNSKKEKKSNKSKERKNNLIKVKIISLIIIAITAIILILMSPLFDIKQIEVVGNNKISKEEIVSLSQISINQNTYRTNLKKAIKMIKSNPYIENVIIKRKLPNTLIINIEERVPTFMMEFGGGYIYLNNQGYALEISETKLEVPILQGAETIAEDIEPGDRLCIDDLEKLSVAIKIMQEAQSNNEEEINAAELITRIDIENKQNYKIIFESEQKVAFIGDGTKLDSKMTWIKKIIKKENGVAGEIFFNITQNSDTPVFRQSV